MADKGVVHIGENSPEQVAFKLLQLVASCEKRSLAGASTDGYTPANRAYILKTYGECILTVRNGWYDAK